MISTRPLSFSTRCATVGSGVHVAEIQLFCDHAIDKRSSYVSSQDGSGTISLDELRTVFETFGQKTKPNRDIFSGRIQNREDQDAMREQAEREFDDDILKMMREVDTDNSGSIDPIEFAELMSAPAAIECARACHLVSSQAAVFCFAVRKMNQQDDPAVLEEAFRFFDQDGSGSIKRDEIKEAFKSVMADTGEELPEREIDDMIQEFDADGDGTIDFEEFKNYMTQGDEGRQANAINNLAKGFPKNRSTAGGGRRLSTWEWRTKPSGAPADAPAPAQAPVTVNAPTRKEKHSICTIQ